MVRGDEGLTPEDCQRLLAAVRVRCDHADEVRLAQRGSLFDHTGPAPVDADAIVCEVYRDEIRDALARNDTAEFHGSVPDYAAELGLTIRSGTLAETMAARVIMRGVADSYEAFIVRFNQKTLPYLHHSEDNLASEDCTDSEGDDVGVAGAVGQFEPTPEDQALIDDAMGVSSRLHTDGSVVSKVDGLASDLDNEMFVGDSEPEGQPRAASPYGSTLQDLWPLFTADMVKTKKWGRDQARQSRATALAWASLFPELDFGKIGTRHGADFQRVMLSLPALYSKLVCWRGRPLRQVAEERERIMAGDGTRLASLTWSNKGKTPDLKRLSAATFNRHISALSRFWEWARQNEHVARDAPNPVRNLWLSTDQDTPVEEGGSAIRPIWTEQDLHKLFSSPLYVGCKSPHRRHVAGSLIIRGALFWLPLIAATTGMRREEIAQLAVGDVKQDPETGIWYFDLTRRSLRLKNKESRRLVPLPDGLLALGFIDQLVVGRAVDEQVFLELKPNQKGVYGDGVGKRFGRYRAHIGLTDAMLDLHALRHTVATNLNRAGVPQSHGEELLGHRSEARRSAFAVYDKGATLQILKEALDRLPAPWLRHVPPFVETL